MNIFSILCIGMPALLLVAAAIMLFSDQRRAAITTGVMAIATGGILLLVTNMMFSGLEHTWEVENTTPLVSLSNASEVSGRGSSSMFGGTTKISEKNVYRYVMRNQDGSFAFGEIDANGLRIVDDAAPGEGRIDDEVCFYRDTTKKNSDSSTDFDGSLAMFGDGPFTACGSRVTVHLPKGAIVNDFLVDPSN